MPTGYTSEVHDGKTVALADYLRTCVRAFILDLKDEPFDAPIPERSTYKDEVVANYERQEREALDAIYKLEGMTDAECEASAQAEYDKTLARMTGYNDKKKVVEARYRAVLAHAQQGNPGGGCRGGREAPHARPARHRGDQPNQRRPQLRRGRFDPWLERGRC